MDSHEARFVLSDSVVLPSVLIARVPARFAGAQAGTACSSIGVPGRRLSSAAGRAADGRDAKRIRATKPGATVGWHTTGQNEESLVILRGQGEALIDGHEKQSFAAPAFLYIPPNTRHNVSNSGKDMLEYVDVVAPAAKR